MNREVTGYDRNLSASQRLWKRRRARWAAYKAGQNAWGRPRTAQQAWQHAVNTGTEREFLKREGEGDQ